MRLPLLCCALFACSACPCLAEEGPAGSEFKVVSPNGNVQFKFFFQDDRLKFTVLNKKTTVIEPSAFVFTVDGKDVGVEIRSQFT